MTLNRKQFCKKNYKIQMNSFINFIDYIYIFTSDEFNISIIYIIYLSYVSILYIYISIIYL